MKFIDTKRFSPVVTGKDLPREGDLFFKDSLSLRNLSLKDLIKFHFDNNIVIDEQWWKKQISRCLYGYTVEDAITEGGDYLVDGIDALWTKEDCYLPEYDLLIKNKSVRISGFYYFFLNFWKMRGLASDNTVKTLTSPKFLAHQFLFSRRLEMMDEQSKDDQETKARQLGFSEILAALIAWYYLFVPMSQCIIVAGEQTDADNTFFNAIRGIDELSNTQFVLKKARGFDNKQHIKSVNGSEILTENANDDPEALSRYSPTLVVYEEIGKGKKGWSLKVAENVRPSIYAEGKKTGKQLFIGTGGNMDKGVTDLQERAYNPDKYNILSFNNKWEKASYTGNIKVAHFTPSWSYKIIDSDGNPLVEESLDYILKEREKMSAKEKYIHISHQAIYLEDVFQMNTAGYFGPERVRLLNTRYNYILTHREAQMTRKGHLEWITPGKIKGGVRFVDATEEEIMREEWWCEILEEPERTSDGHVYDFLYTAGTDTYNQDIAENSDSEGAFTVYKKWRNNSESPFHNTWVLLIFERPGLETGGQKAFFEHTLMACVYYNCQNNHEYVNPLFFEYYERMNATQYLLEKPLLAFAGQIKDMKTSNRYGTDKSLKPHILSLSRDILDEEQINRMWIPRQIYALSKFRYTPGDKYNCDITIATAESLVGYKENEEIVVRDRSIESEEPQLIWKIENGVLIRATA